MNGKLRMIKAAMESALNAGKKIAYGSPGGWLIMKRYGKLTSITPYKPEPVKIFADEWIDL